MKTFRPGLRLLISFLLVLAFFVPPLTKAEGIFTPTVPVDSSLPPTLQGQPSHTPFVKATPVPGKTSAPPATPSSITPAPATTLPVAETAETGYCAYHYLSDTGLWALAQMDEAAPNQYSLAIRMVFKQGYGVRHDIVGWNLYINNKLHTNLTNDETTDKTPTDFTAAITLKSPITAAYLVPVVYADNVVNQAEDPTYDPLQEMDDIAIPLEPGRLAMITSPVKEDRLILRRYPSTAGDIIGNYYSGLYLAITHQVDDTWAKVQVGHGPGAGIGYMSKKFLLTGSDVLKADLYKPAFQEEYGFDKLYENTVIKPLVVSSWKFFEAPDAAAKVLSVQKSTKGLEILGIFYDFYQVEVEGQFGFVHKDSLYQPQPTSQPTPTPGPTKTVAQALAESKEALATPAPSLTDNPTPAPITAPEKSNAPKGPLSLKGAFEEEKGYKAAATADIDENRELFKIEVTLTYPGNYFANTTIEAYNVYVNKALAGRLDYTQQQEAYPTRFAATLDFTKPHQGVPFQKPLKSLALVPLLAGEETEVPSAAIELYPSPSP